nr:hypothetical protein [Pectobacterium carotovorum]
MKILLFSGFIIGLLGVGLVSYGAWSIYPAAGYITSGTFCLFWSWSTARAAPAPALPLSTNEDE